MNRTKGEGLSKSQRKNRKRKLKKKQARRIANVLDTERALVSGKGAYTIRRPRITGKGAYFAPDYFERLGDQFLGAPGKVVGEGVGSILRAFGLGDYDLQENSLVPKLAMDMGQEVPQVSNNKLDEGCRIQRTEYIGDLLTGSGGTPTGFSIESFSLNPGNPELFPWLASVAENFEEYEFDGIIFTLKTMASDVSTALSLGTMFCACQYDIFDPPFLNKQELLEYQYASSKKVSKSVLLPIECAKKNDVLTHLYVAPRNTLPVGADPRFYSMGNVVFGTQGCPAAGTPVAEVWVSYDVCLYKPKLTDGGDLALSNITAHWNSVGVGSGNFPGLTSTFPLGTSLNAQPVAGSTQMAGLIMNSGALGNVGLPSEMSQGTFLVVIDWSTTGAAVAIVAPGIAPTNCTLKSWWLSGSSSISASPPNGTTAKSLTLAFILQVNAENAMFTVGSAGTLPVAAVYAADLWITQLDGNVTG